MAARAPGTPGGTAAYDVRSPDGTRAAFVRDYNLWVRDVATGAETQLTTDGIKDFAYATNDAGWTRSDDAGGRLVARLEEDRHVPARLARSSARCIRQHRRRASDADDAEDTRCRATTRSS